MGRYQFSITIYHQDSIEFELNPDTVKGASVRAHASVDRRRDSSPPESYDGGQSDGGWADGTPAASKSAGVRNGRGRRRGAQRGRRRAGGRESTGHSKESFASARKFVFSIAPQRSNSFLKKRKEKMCFLRFRGRFPHLPTQRYSLSDIDGEERANLQAGSSRAPSIAMAREQEQSPMQRRLRSVFAHLCVTKLIW
jgi:hypothetical protein